MAYTNSTPNYGLPLPTDSDRSTWTDNNTSFSAVDTALKSTSDGVATLNTALAALEARVAALESAQPQSLAGFIKYDAEAVNGLTNAQYSKLVIQS